MARPRGTLSVLCALAALAGCSGGPPPVPPAAMSADEVRAFFERDPAGRASLGLDGPADRPFCGVDVLGGSTDARWTYAWISCSTYSVEGGRAQERSGVALSVRLDATTRTATLAQDGSAYAPSIRAMFPPALAELVLDQDVRVDRTPEQLRAAAEKELATTP